MLAEAALSASGRCPTGSVWNRTDQACLAVRGTRMYGFGALWVQVVGGERFGPYANSRWNHLLDFARIGSRFGRPREVWEGRRWPERRVRRYAKGKRTIPREVTDEQRRRERLHYTGSPTFRRTAVARRAA